MRKAAVKNTHFTDEKTKRDGATCQHYPGTKYGLFSISHFYTLKKIQIFTHARK